MTARPRILVTGSRDWDNRDLIARALRYHFQAYPDAILVHGAARGADSLAAEYWAGLVPNPGERVEAHPVTSRDWELNPRRAGLDRNLYMISLGATIGLAFQRGRSPGTQHCLEHMIAAGIPVYPHAYQEPKR